MHPTVELEYQGETVEIDEDLAPLISEIWKAGIDTTDACQDVGEAVSQLVEHLPHTKALSERSLGRASIGFASEVDLCKFYDALANSGPRDAFYVRMMHWAAPDAWEVKSQVVDDYDDEETKTPQRSLFYISEKVTAEFPRTDIPEILRRMRSFNAGELPEPGPIDWSSVQVNVED